MSESSAEAKQVCASDGDRRRNARLSLPMAELRGEEPIANRLRNRGNQCSGVGGKRRCFARGRDMIGALRGHEAKRTLRRRVWLVLVTARRIGGLTQSKAAKDKAGLIRRSA